MIKIKMDPQNKKVEIQIKNISMSMNRGIRRGFFLAGKKLVRDTRKDIMRKPRHGRVYNVNIRGKRRRHTASVPGEAPANMTGALRKSVSFKVGGSRYMKFGYSKAVDYGKWLENGTATIAPRPGLKINIKKNLKVIHGYFRDSINSNIKRR